MRTVPRKFVLATAVLVASAAAVAASVTPASADPLSTTTVKATDIVSTGSDTIQVFDDAISSDRTGGYPGLADGTGKYYSWDATPQPSNITPKTGATSIARPNGSSAGITELNNSTSAEVDLARSSRGPKTGTTDWFIAFARDAVGYSGFTGGNAPAGMTTAQLKAIYTCTPPGKSTPQSSIKWSDINSAWSATTIHVYLPQATSGTRAFFLSALNISATTEPCWEAYGPEENEGTDPVFATDKDVIFPYSIAHFVGQTYYSRGSGNDNVGTLDALRSIDSVAQVDTVNKQINPAFGSSSSVYGRNVYHVVRQTDWADATEGPRLKGLLDTSANGGWLCKNNNSSVTQPDVLTSYGFLNLSAAACGAKSPGI